MDSICATATTPHWRIWHRLIVILSHVFEHITDQKTHGRYQSRCWLRALVYIRYRVSKQSKLPIVIRCDISRTPTCGVSILENLTAVMAGWLPPSEGERVRSFGFTPDETTIPMDQGGYERAVRALARAETTPPLLQRPTSGQGCRQMLGAERASKLKRSLSRSW